MTILALAPHQPVCSSCALACGHIPMHPIGWTYTAVCTLCGETKACAPAEDYRPGSPEAITQAIRERMGASESVGDAEREPLVRIEMIGGNCPVQAEGFILGRPFYFRARGQRLSMGIGDDPVGIPHPVSLREDFPSFADEWFCDCAWGKWPVAGWMPEEEARRLIEWCAKEYAAHFKDPAPEPTSGQQSVSEDVA